MAREYQTCSNPEAHGIKLGHIPNSTAAISCLQGSHHIETKIDELEKTIGTNKTKTPWQPPPSQNPEDRTLDTITGNYTKYDTSKELVLILTRGLPASGKTSWAKQWVQADPNNRARINRDDLRNLTYNQYVLEAPQEKQITNIQKALLKEYLFNPRSRKSVIMDDTFLNPQNIKDIINFITDQQTIYSATYEGKQRKVKVIIKDFPLTVDEAIERNKQREENKERSVPEHAIKRMARKSQINKKGEIQPLSEELIGRVINATYAEKPEQYKEDKKLTKAAYLVDVDGTLAYIDKTKKGYRSPFDFTRVSEDKPNHPVINMVKALKAMGKYIIVMSGREDSCQPETEEWLKKYGVPYDEIHMRKTGDQRKDSIIKWELYQTYVQGKVNVEACIDDRNQVVEMYRSRGFKVFQVAPGDF